MLTLLTEEKKPGRPHRLPRNANQCGGDFRGQCLIPGEASGSGRVGVGRSDSQA